jgi:hypothetical protein
MTYREMMDEENDEIMREMRDRQAEVRAIQKRFEGDPEGYRRFMDAQIEALGFRNEPTGHGTTRLVKMTP